MSNLIISGIRTAAPYVAGLIVAWLTARGLQVPPEMLTWLVGLLTFAVGTAWYLIVRALEARWPVLGVLLGVPRKPSYVKGEVLERRDVPLR